MVGYFAMQTLLQDLRTALRQLRKSRGFTVVVVVTIALGIGVNTAIFSVVNGFVRPLPVPVPEQITVLAAQIKGDDLGYNRRFSYPALVDLRKQADAFSHVFGTDLQLGGLSYGGRANPVVYSIVTGNYFSALGVKPAAGRLLLAGEGERSGTPLTLVLGYSCWQKRFGGDRGAIGRQVRLDGKTATIVGVVSKEFHGTDPGVEMDAYVPLNFFTLLDNRSFSGFFEDRNVRRLTVLGRLKAGVSVAQAQIQLNVIARRLPEQYPATDKDLSFRVLPERFARPLQIPVLADVVPLVSGLFLLLGAMVLLVACMNVANILMVRATLRRREMAVRTALGSSRSRLVRQTLTESIVLALLGGAAGVMLGVWTSDAISSIRLEIDLPARLDFSFDWRVFTYALAAAVFTGILTGMWPALRGSRGDVSMVLHESGRGDAAGAGRHGVRSALVVAQVAGSLMLLVIAGLFVRQLERAQRIDLGFDPDHVLNVAMDPHQIGYGKTRTEEFYRQLLARARATTGVESASLAISTPMGYWDEGNKVYIEGHPPVPGQQPPVIGCNSVSTGYFETLRMPLRGGRTFRELDSDTAPLVAIVNETMAKQFWPNQDPIGKRFSTTSASGPFIEVVGTARDGKYLVLFESRQPHFYLPLTQSPSSLRVLQIRSSIPPELLANRVQREIQELDPEMPITDLRPMKQALGGVMGLLMFRLGAFLAAAMGMLGLALAVVGVYGVVSFAASQRTHEIGIRMALGADARDVRRMILRHGLRLVITGVLAGLIAAFSLTRIAGSLLPFVSSSDPATYLGVTLLLGLVALWACYVPARRAMRVDPIVALRHE
jgi:macrolide transport system ATP-binding/permease protein